MALGDTPPTLDDADFLAFCDSIMRPISDRMTGLRATLAINLKVYKDQFAGYVNQFANTDEIVKSGPNDTRSQLVKQDATRWYKRMLIIEKVLNGTALDIPGDTDADVNGIDSVEKPHVNTFIL